MDRITVDSSNIASIGYEYETEDMEVEFNSGAIYVYSNVPDSVANDFVKADSVGKYFHANIRGKYDFTKS